LFSFFGGAPVEVVLVIYLLVLGDRRVISLPTFPVRRSMQFPNPGTRSPPRGGSFFLLFFFHPVRRFSSSHAKSSFSLMSGKRFPLTHTSHELPLILQQNPGICPASFFSTVGHHPFVFARNSMETAEFFPPKKTPFLSSWQASPNKG